MADIELTREEAVAVVALNRPAKRNAVTMEMQADLAAAFTAVAADPAIRAVVLTGMGADFSVGGDREVVERIDHQPGFTRQATAAHRGTIASLLALDVPVIAAVEGAAFGFGAELVACCDLVIMGEGARLADPHVPLGRSPAPVVVVAWPQQTSRLVAAELILTGRQVGAAEAVTLGLANRAVAAGEARAQAMALAQTLAALPDPAVRSATRAVRLDIVEVERFYPDSLDG